MKREISLEEISDGKLYGSSDMVKVGCKKSHVNTESLSTL